MFENLRITPNLRVLHVAETVAGGIASYLEELVPFQLNAYGPDSVKIIAPEHQIQHINKIPQSNILPFPASSSRFLNVAGLVSAVSKARISFRPNILNIHSSIAGLSIRPLMLIYRDNPAAIVYCSHGWAFNRESPFLVRYATAFVERMLSGMCSCIICVSTAEFNSAVAHGINPDRMSVVYNGIAASPPGQSTEVIWPDGHLRVLFVGRLDRQKGVDVLVEALSRLHDKAFAYVIGGAVVDSQEIPFQSDNVCFLGWQSREFIEGYYRSADVLVMPSRWEAFGLTAIEAMRAGLPVIASRVGGLSEVVEEGVTGYLFEKNDARSLERLIRSADRDLLAQMGAAGRLRFNRLFSSERVFSAMDMHYTQALASDS